MKLKLNQNGTAVVRDGKPVYVHANGREEAFDAPAAMKLALSKHFEASPVMAGLKIPHDVATAFFGDHFQLQGGKLVALDKLGIQRYSQTRFGEAATFDEAFAQIVDSYKDKAMILKEPDAPAPGQPGQSGARGRNGPTITRPQFDAMPPATRAKFMSEGGCIGDVASAAVPAPAPAQRGGTINRAQFDALGPKERAQHFSSGGKLVD
jgi:hypothetical protein